MDSTDAPYLWPRGSARDCCRLSIWSFQWSSTSFLKRWTRIGPESKLKDTKSSGPCKVVINDKKFWRTLYPFCLLPLVAVHNDAGLVQAMPLVSFWYERLIRATAGRLLSTAGVLVHTATETAHLISLRSKQIDYHSKRKTLESTSPQINGVHWAKVRAPCKT